MADGGVGRCGPQGAESEQIDDLKRDCDGRLAGPERRQAAQAFRGAVDEARNERDAMKSELLKVRSALKEARSDLECTEGAYSEREAALAERCDSAERRCQELDAELTTAQRDAAEWKRSAQDFEETSQIIERKVSELEATVSRQRSDSARKATQWESRCNELEDALDQSARDFESLRAESERVKEGKRCRRSRYLSELDEAASPTATSRLRPNSKKRFRAQKDQEHADGYVERMRRPCRLEMMSTVQLLRGRRNGSRTSCGKPTRRTLLNLRRLCSERGRRPRHLAEGTRPITRGGTRPR